MLTMKHEKGNVMVGTRITKKAKQQITQFVDDGNCMNESDFIRTAIREKLNRERKE